MYTRYWEGGETVRGGIVGVMCCSARGAREYEGDSQVAPVRRGYIRLLAYSRIMSLSSSN